MNEPVCKRCDIEMAPGIIVAPNTPGAIYWESARDEAKAEELSRLSKKDLKQMLKQKDFASLNIVNILPMTAFRCSSCGSIEFFAREEG
jgi:hypothetical protein